MALTLPPALRAAQDAVVRQPVIELKASSFSESIPFAGNNVDEMFKDEYALTTILHSSGCVCAAYIVVNDNIYATIQYVRTNTDRTEFNYVDLLRFNFNGTEELTMCELRGGDVGLIVRFGNVLAAAYILGIDGSVKSKKDIPGTKDAYGLGILARNDDYFIMFSKPAAAVVPVIGGNYTEERGKEYTIIITKDGANTVSSFKFASEEIPMNGSAVQPLENGLTIAFPAATYYKGQEFYFTVYGATYSHSDIGVEQIPVDGATIQIAGVTYTFRNALTLLPEDPADPESPCTVEIPYEVKIDHQSREITLENLNCAINCSSYDEVGAGERYGRGTAPHTLVYSERKRGDTIMYVTARAYGNKTYVVTHSDGSGTSGGNVTGGVNPTVSAVSSFPSCKTYTASSPDFMVWSAPQGYDIPGIVPTRDKRRYSFAKLDDGKVLLWFDCVTAGRTGATAVYNIFFSGSVDGGFTWSQANAVTNYNNPQVIAKNVRCAQKTADEATLAYQESYGCLQMGRFTPGNPFGDLFGGLVFNIDFIRRRAYISIGWERQSDSYTSGFIEVDIDEWRIMRYWNRDTAPAVPWMLTEFFMGAYARAGYWYSTATHSEGRYLVWVKPQMHAIYIFDVLTNRGKEIHFANFTAADHYTLTANVNLSGSSISADHSPMGAHVDEASGKLWVVLSDDMAPTQAVDNIKSTKQELASLDLQQIFDLNVNYYDVSVTINLTFGKTVHELRWIDYNRSENVWTFTWYCGNRCIRVIDAASGGLLYHVDAESCRNFPVLGVEKCVYHGGKLYGGAIASADESKYNGMSGLCIVDLATMQANYYQPPGGYSSGSVIGDVIVTDDNKVLLGCEGSAHNSIHIYDLERSLWTTLNNETVPGLREFSSATSRVAYDESTGSIYIIEGHGGAGGSGLQMINIDGKVERLVYRDIQLSDMAISVAKPLAKGNAETEPHIFYADEQLYAFWLRKKIGTRRVVWDKEAGVLDLSKYLLRGSEIAIAKAIDGEPQTLHFELANGHFFDPTNTRSLLSGYIKKGKRITLRLGESQLGTTTYQSLPDVFTITRCSLTFKRGQYPSIKVECQDRRTLYKDLRVIATRYYEGVAPHAVLSGILQEYGGYAQHSFNLPTVDETGALIKGQFIDKSLAEILEDIGSRYGYFFAVQPGDILTMRKIDLDADPVHIYSGGTWLIDYTPDDSFSDMTNKITVTGESPDKTTVIMPEELVLEESGTIGWYKRKNTKRLYYSDDGQKECINPRLVKIETASSVAFKLAGKVKEFIAGEDRINHTYVDVAIEAPDLTVVFLSALAMILLSKNMPPVVVPSPITGISGFAQSKEAAMMESVGLWTAFQCLGAIANYQYEIYAQPIGYVRRSYQYSVVDDDLLHMLNGTVVEKKIEDPLCYTAEHCRKVAELEMRITKAQRNRVKMTKIAHYQDEPGDVIEINHPYNKLQQRIYVTNITRRILIPSAGSADGYILDDIEGWKL